MLNPIVSCTVYAFETLIAYIFFSRIADRRISSVKALLIGFALFELGSVLNLVFQNNVWVNTTVSILATFLFTLWCFEIKPLSAVAYVLILAALNFALELVTVLVLSTLIKAEALALRDNLALLIVNCAASKILYFFTCLILSGIVKPKSNHAKVPSNLLFYPVSVTICLGIFWYICVQDGITYEIQFLLALSSIICFGSTILLFIIYQHQIEENSEYIRLKSEFDRLQTEKTYYDILEQQNQQLLIYAHDTKKHLAAIQSLSTDPDIDVYISKLSDQLKSYSKNCHSGNKLLDVMISKYVLDSDRRGIHFEYNVRSCNLKNMDEIDLVAVLGNLMDNALTSAEKSREKHIVLETTIRNGYEIIVISNSCDTAPDTHGGHLVTSKEDKKLHGFGLKSVAKTLKKYHGDFSWEYDDAVNTFITTVMIGKQ